MCWSPDGLQIAFDSQEAGDWNVYVIDADGGAPRRLTPESSSDTRGTWSRDGRLVYFASDRSGRSEIWKVGPGGGEAIQVTRGGGVYALDSPDGKHLFYTKAEAPGGIWRVPTSGGEETEILPGRIGWGAYVRTRSGLYFQASVPTGGLAWDTIRHLDFATGRVSDVARRTGPLRGGLAVSPDEKWILYDAFPGSTSELMLVENFR